MINLRNNRSRSAEGLIRGEEVGRVSTCPFRGIHDDPKGVGAVLEVPDLIVLRSAEP
ncbi:MAG: hypothetical protein ACTSRL_21250 [Candidatus Helarchaeota archaeon]